MLPFVLGGVALAATGFGIKKYFDNEENREKLEDTTFRIADWLVNSDMKDVETFYTFWRDPYLKFLLEKKQMMVALKDAFDLLQEIRHNEWLSPLEPLTCFNYNDSCHFESLDPSVKAEARMFFTIALNASEQHKHLLEELDVVVLHTNDYTEYTDQQKVKVYQLTMLTVMLLPALCLFSNFNNDTLNRTTIRMFERLKMFSEEVAKSSPEA